MQWLVCFLFTTTAFAGWVVNPDHSEILFKTTYLNETEVTGRFNRYTGDVDFDAQGVPTKLNLRIEVASIDTGHKIRDGHLRANDFLRAQKFPHITFVSSRIRALEDHAYQAQGELALRGTARPFTVNFELRPAVTDTWGHPSKFAKFSGKIRRQDFGIHWNKTIENNLLMLGDEVSFWGTMQLQDRAELTPGPKHLIPDTPYIRERERMLRGETTEAEFKQKFPRALVEQPAAAVPPAPALATLSDDVVTKEVVVDPRTGFVWWSSFIFLGLIGFMGTLGGMLYVKKYFLEKDPEKYNEVGKQGFLTDGVGIIVLLVYAIAFWNVGWGRVLH